MQKSSLWDSAVVGGPATRLMPDYLVGIKNVTIGNDMPGVLQRINPKATRTTTGCVRSCKFCAIGTGKIEKGGFNELEDWPDLPIVCDNNLLAASIEHFDKVMDRLERHVGVDFNQGLDARLMTQYHATRIARLKKPKIRLALDNTALCNNFAIAIWYLMSAGCSKSSMSSYAIIGFDSDPAESWERCLWIEKTHKIKSYPMWFHPLDALRENQVTDEQAKLGWTERERLRIMGYFYKHRGKPPL